ncbi:LysM peptidoglycan-binding domain-containing protein [Psychrobacter pocilloporae]|uniref:Peptigoglycan-binding protein LysM n=1 Tax=Psychrobacter pocilloporae TaxID=1775882 RepID=A0ABT6IQN7_9GAMM|nr:LysM peptidoglycan-binding domain-containing protein [Psychrobacter pocilloporae]MDH4904138.1 peptigoglycan-binding protein LysM [Psychrobacter pocilloporae]HBD03640.1 peptigoglycan-binding protein LysM [Psychrobacter sp.]
MNFSRQALLGIGMILGGSVMLYAMVQQIGESNQPQPTSAMIEKPTTEQESPQPLTTDIETEKRILAQKQKERAARVAEQERRAQEFLTEQEVAEAEALAKARAESQQYVKNIAATNEQSESSEDVKDTDKIVKSKEVQDAEKLVKAADDAVNEAKAKKQAEDEQQQAKAKQEKAAAEKLAESKKEAEAKRQADAQAAAEKKREAAEAAKNEPPKSPSDYQVKKGDGLIKLARQYNMPVEVLAQANNISPSTSLQLGQNITIPSRSQVQRLEREAAAAEKAAEAKREAQQKLREARQEVKETDAKGSFGVQVALADNQAKADQLAKKFKEAGYQVKTSPTSRGVRVIVGPERGKVAALALKDKINSDSNVNTTGAWVLYWR